jgi:hypothetical protein
MQVMPSDFLRYQMKHPWGELSIFKSSRKRNEIQPSGKVLLKALTTIKFQKVPCMCRRPIEVSGVLKASHQ